MFTPEEIQQRFRQKPFRPVRIVASEGLRYDIHHPDLVLVGRHDLTIGIPDPSNPSIYDGVVRVAIVHVVGLQDLPVSAASPTNGPTAQSSG